MSRPGSSTHGVSRLHEVIGQLRQCVGSLRSEYGDSTGVRRVANDVERLHIDVEDLTGQRHRASRREAAMAGDRILVSDVPYDPDLWRDADDEGVGGYHGSAR